MGARRRGLGDVLHYFISEEEQREARERARGGVTPPGRWALLSRPPRLLDRSLILDLAAALAEEGGPVDVLAPFGPNGSTRRWPSVRWSELSGGGTPAEEGAGIGAAMDRARSDAHVLAAVPAVWASGLMEERAHRPFSGILVPVDAAPWGVEEALARIRPLRGSGAIRVCAFVVGTDGTGDSELLGALAAAARDELRLPLESLGSVVRDAASYRALLLDTPVLEVDRQSPSSRSLTTLARAILGAT